MQRIGFMKSAKNKLLIITIKYTSYVKEELNYLVNMLMDGRKQIHLTHLF